MEGDGYYGWEEFAPFDAIIVTAAPDHLPAPLAAQLAPTYISPFPLQDGWGTAFRYTTFEDPNLPQRLRDQPGETGYRIRSLGPDGKPETPDDIVFENGEFMNPPED